MIDTAALHCLMRRKPTADTLITEYLGGMPANAQVAELQRCYLNKLMAGKDQDKLRAQYPNAQAPQKGEQPHPDYIRYCEAMASANTRLAARAGTEVLKEHPEICRRAGKEQRAWHALANLVLDRAVELRNTARRQANDS